MAYVSNIYRQRRDDFDAALEQQIAAGTPQAIMAASRMISDETARKREEARARQRDAAAEQERKRRAKREEDEARRREESTTYERTRQTEQDQAAREERERRARMDDERATAQRRSGAVDDLRRRARGGATEEDLRGVAQSDGYADFFDDDAVAAIVREEEGRQAQEIDEDALRRARLRKLDADTAKASRAGTPRNLAKLPLSAMEQARTDKAIADARKAKAEADAAEKALTNPKKETGLPAEQASERALKVEGLSLLDRLRKSKEDVGTGPIEGPVKDAVGFFFSNPKRKEFLQLNNAVQRIAGRILEGGKLAEGDARVYERFILNPDNMDDDEYVYVLDSIEKTLRDDLSAFDQEMKAAGRTVGPSTLVAPEDSDDAARRTAYDD